MAYRVLPQQGGDAIDSEALANAAGVEIHGLRRGEGNRSGCCVQEDMPPSNFFAESRKLGVGGDAALVEEESPGAEKRADCNVECTVGLAAPVKGAFEELKGFGVGGDRAVGGLAADAHELAGGAVVAQESFDAIDLVEAEVHGLFG
jgi:hypothetical protein